jgi:DNA-binding MarR family transcriptional regulator
MPATGGASSSEAILAALTANPNATAAELADVASIGRSTAAKTLAALEGQGKARRTPGGRDGGRRLPDRWALTAPTTRVARAEKASQKGVTGGSADAPAPARLGKGELRDLVLAYLNDRPGEALTPTALGKATGHSPGAIGNALRRLAEAGEVVEVSSAPRRYTATI